jgi:hypothetical protein
VNPSKFKQGTYVPKNPMKFKGSAVGHGKAVYRSSWELKVMLYLDQCSSIIAWGSELIWVTYVNPMDGKTHKYFIDLYFEAIDKEGNIKKFLVEIKPHSQSIPPVKPKRMTEASSRTFTSKALTYAQNQAKWKAASEYAKNRGYTFFVLTEKNAAFLVKN